MIDVRHRAAVSVALIVGMLLCGACGEDPIVSAPTATAPPVPGPPASIAIAYVITQPHQALFTATVLDARRTPVAQATVAFAASEGTMTPRTRTCDARGVAQSTLRALGGVTVTVRVTQPAATPRVMNMVHITL